MLLPFAAALLSGCVATRVTPDIAYFPEPPSPPRVVHLKSFNSLNDVVPARRNWIDAIRGGPVSPFVGTPAGIAYRDDHLYICDTDLNAVHDWNLATGKARRIGLQGAVALGKPVDVAVDAAGNIFVADTERAEVVAFDSTGSAGRRFRPPGRNSYRPVAVTLHEPRLYAADIAGHMVDVYATDSGEHLETIGRTGSAPGKFYYPMGLATDEEGRLYVSEMLNARVQVFDPAHHAVLTFGQPGNRYGDLGKPKDIAVAPDGIVFVADSDFLHVHVFNRQGQLLMLLGGPGTGPGEPAAVPGKSLLAGTTPMPAGVAVAASLPEPLAALVPADFAAEYFLFVTNTIGPKRINLFAIGQRR